MKILGIESSCDETAAAVVSEAGVHADVVSTQIATHQPYGGVVPELASRDHMRQISRVVSETMTQAQCDWSDIDAVVATQGPGLIGALVVGLQAAKTIAMARGIPFVGGNHLRGHMLAARIPGEANAIPAYPYIALLASGGHTGIYQVDAHDRITCLGQTRDDAAGEAFDKVAKVLGLGYPGGPIIDRLAQTPGDEVTFPQSLRQRRSYEFSFSGIKTAVAQYVANAMKAHGDAPLPDEELLAVVRGFQRAVVETLVRKTVLAAREKQIPRVVLAGGVAANSALRAHAQEACDDRDLQLFMPPRHRCTDNAAMIAWAGLLSFRDGMRTPLSASPRASWPL